MRRVAFILLLLPLACSRETPAPPAPPATTTTAAPQPTLTATQTSVPELQKGTYDEALLWFRSVKHFRFSLGDRRLGADGEMTRTTPGTEKVRFTLNDQEWLAETTPQGVTWKLREGGTWKLQEEGPFGGSRIFQHVTVVFDPQKKEGVPLLVSTEGDTNVYRFTNANTGEVHEVTVRKADSSIARITIGDTMEMTIEP